MENVAGLDIKVDYMNPREHSEGCDFLRNASHANVDFACIHMYQENWAPDYAKVWVCQTVSWGSGGGVMEDLKAIMTYVNDPSSNSFIPDTGRWKRC